MCVRGPAHRASHDNFDLRQPDSTSEPVINTRLLLHTGHFYLSTGSTGTKPVKTRRTAQWTWFCLLSAEFISPSEATSSRNDDAGVPAGCWARGGRPPSLSVLPRLVCQSVCVCAAASNTGVSSRDWKCSPLGRTLPDLLTPACSPAAKSAETKQRAVAVASPRRYVSSTWQRDG